MISTLELASRLDETGLVIIDASWFMPGGARDPAKEYAAGHIPGAVFFDIDATSDHTTGLPHMAAYCASKAGLNALLDALRVECQPLGIYCTTLCPGWIRTPMTAQVDYPMPHLMEVPDACRLMLEAIRARRPFYAFPPRMARCGSGGNPMEARERG